MSNKTFRCKSVTQWQWPFTLCIRNRNTVVFHVQKKIMWEGCINHGLDMIIERRLQLGPLKLLLAKFLTWWDIDGIQIVLDSLFNNCLKLWQHWKRYSHVVSWVTWSKLAHLATNMYLWCLQHPEVTRFPFGTFTEDLWQVNRGS